MTISIYDVETYKNYFCVTFKHLNKEERFKFVLDEERKINQVDDLINYVNNPDINLCGYNNHSFDDHIIDLIIKNPKITNKEIYVRAQAIGHDWENYKFSPLKRTIDLYKVTYLNKQMKGLKQVAVNLKHDLIQDLPYDYDSMLTNEQKDAVLEYNQNDIAITEKLFNHIIIDMRMRVQLEKLYKINCISESNSGLANRIFEKMYASEIAEDWMTNEEIYSFKNKKTERSSINLKDVIFPFYYTCFKTKHIQEFVSKLSYYKVSVVGEKFDFKPIILTIGNLNLTIGSGGIHSIDEPYCFEENDEDEYWDCDVESMYPTLIIKYGICPAHLNKSVFLYVYNNKILIPRLIAKKEKREVESYGLKLVANSIYGKFKSLFSWLRDPLCTLQTTINGQLSLIYLIEKLTLKGFEVISANTDGIVTKVDKKRRDLYHNICKEWEEEVKMKLEFTQYSKYVRRDVNNYLAVTTTGKVKTKGDFSKNLHDDLTKGYYAPIIAEAIENYYVKGISVSETLTKEKDIYKFLISKKADKKFTMYYRYIENGKPVEKELQKTNRYYISTGNGSGVIYKKEGNKEINLESKRFVVLANDLRNFTLNNHNKIDYDYYKREVYKIIDQIEMRKNQTTLF